MLAEYFHAAYYINLEARQDRRANFERRARQAGLGRVQRFAAICPEPFSHDAREHFKLGCTLSHQGVVRLAQARGETRILIFEDDCTFAPNFATEFLKCAIALASLERSASPHAQWDVCYFGGSPHPHYFDADATCRVISDALAVNPGAVWGAHAYAVHERFYEKFLACTAYPADMTLICVPPATRTYLMSTELLVYQDDDSFSDLWGDTISRTELYDTDYRAHIGSQRKHP